MYFTGIIWFLSNGSEDSDGKEELNGDTNTNAPVSDMVDEEQRKKDMRAKRLGKLTPNGSSGDLGMDVSGAHNEASVVMEEAPSKKSTNTAMNISDGSGNKSVDPIAKSSLKVSTSDIQSPARSSTGKRPISTDLEQPSIETPTSSSRLSTPMKSPPNKKVPLSEEKKHELHIRSLNLIFEQIFLFSVRNKQTEQHIESLDIDEDAAEYYHIITLSNLSELMCIKLSGTISSSTGPGSTGAGSAVVYLYQSFRRLLVKEGSVPTELLKLDLQE